MTLYSPGTQGISILPKDPAGQGLCYQLCCIKDTSAAQKGLMFYIILEFRNLCCRCGGSFPWS